MSDELQQVWARVQDELARAVDEPTYRIWLAPLTARELTGGCLRLEAPPHSCGWIRDRFGSVLRASVVAVLGAHATVELAGAEDEPMEERDDPAGGLGRAARRPARPGGPRASRRRPPAPPPGSREAEPPAGSGGLVGRPLANPKLTFDQFVIGDSNRLAHAAALTVAEMPADAYNPLFICGPPGVGKSHLLNAIASLLRCHSPGLAVRATTGEAFTNEFLNALSDGQTDWFKARFRHIDVLLLDDVQFLERKTRTEEEFFHTFNALHEAGRQIVLTSDRPPHDLQSLEDRLRERFQAGLVADVRPPELNTRLAILRKRVQHDRVTLADDLVLGLIARRVEGNVRALEGALIRIVAFGSLTGRPLTVELAGEVLDTLSPPAARSGPRSIAEIQAAACEHFGVSYEELLSPTRTSRIAGPRQVAMYLARELTEESLPAIGREFGGRDHTTVLHAWRRTTARIASDAATRKAVEKLCQSLDGRPR